MTGQVAGIGRGGQASAGQGKAPGGEPGRVLDAARQFEALLLAQMLKSARESGSGGWLGGGEDQSAASMTELAEEQVAAMMAASGGLGLARMLAEGLNRSAAATQR